MKVKSKVLAILKKKNSLCSHIYMENVRRSPRRRTLQEESLTNLLFSYVDIKNIYIYITKILLIFFKKIKNHDTRSAVAVVDLAKGMFGCAVCF
jgi:hypothetical protein